MMPEPSTGGAERSNVDGSLWRLHLCTWCCSGGARRQLSGERLRACGWCNRVDVDGAWTEVEDATARLGLFERPEVPAVAHGVCGECERRMAALLGG